MTGRKRILVAMGVIAVMAAGTIFAVAGARRHGFGHGPRSFGMERMLGRAQSYLGLSEEQVARIRTILDGEKPKVQPIVAQLARNHQALRELTANGAFDEARVQQLAQEQGAQMAALLVEKERAKTQIYQVLTPEQRAKADQFRDRVEQRVREHFLQGQ